MEGEEQLLGVEFLLLYVGGAFDIQRLAVGCGRRSDCHIRMVAQRAIRWQSGGNSSGIRDSNPMAIEMAIEMVIGMANERGRQLSPRRMSVASIAQT